MARRFMLDKDGKLIDVTGTEQPYNRIDVTATRPPVVEGLTVDMTRAQRGGPVADPMAQFNSYEQQSPRRIGSMPGGERSVVTNQGAPIITGADRRLQEDYGGIRILDGEAAGTDPMGNRIKIDNNPEGFAPIVSQDGRLSLSPGAIDALGQRQMQDEQAAKAMREGAAVAPSIGMQRIDLRSVLQKQADQGFVRPGTDARNFEAMDATLARGDETWLKRNRPAKMIERGNTRDQIMAQALGAQNTPQVMTQDGVMAGYDPITKKIVSDSSGAQAMAASKIKDISLDSETDKTIMDETAKLEMRKSGKLTGDYALVYAGMAKTDPKMAEEFKNGIIGTWSDKDEQQLSRYSEHGIKRGLYKPPSSAPTGSAKGAQWKKK